MARQVTIHWSTTEVTGGDEDHGVYQICGKHLLYADRMPMILYIGKADQQDFAARRAQHAQWTQHEQHGVRFRYGRLSKQSYAHDQLHWSDWTRLLHQVEAALIYWSSPPYNSQAIRAYAGPHLDISNEGDRGDLPEKLDTCAGPMGAPAPASTECARSATLELPSVPHGSPGGPDAWRPLARDAARSQLQALNWPLPLTHRITLSVRFTIVPDQRPFDLDNALKSVFDALGAAGLFRPAKTGHLTEWNTEDHLVWAVTAEKCMGTAPMTTVEIAAISRSVGMPSIAYHRSGGMLTPQERNADQARG